MAVFDDAAFDAPAAGADWCGDRTRHVAEPVRSFLETTGCGMEGSVAGHEIWMGSAAWLESRGACSRRREGGCRARGESDSSRRDLRIKGSVVHVAMDGQYRGGFVLAGAMRPETGAAHGQVDEALRAGVVERRQRKGAGAVCRDFWRPGALHFNQSPLNKLGFIRQLQDSGRTVMMVGDGLNDAGGLQQSDVGVAVVENVSAFSPASDVILAADMVSRLAEILSFAKHSVRVVRASFLVSAAYNVVGIYIAARGGLSPVVCAILMPLSSVTVVAFACGATAWRARRLDF